MKLITGCGGCHVLLKEVSSYEEAFYEMRRFLEVNDIYSNRTEIEEIMKISVNDDRELYWEAEIPISLIDVKNGAYNDDDVVFQDVEMGYDMRILPYKGRRAVVAEWFRIVYDGAEQITDFSLFEVGDIKSLYRYYMKFEDLPTREEFYEMNEEIIDEDDDLDDGCYPYSVERGVEIDDERDQLFYDEIKVYLDDLRERQKGAV